MWKRLLLVGLLTAITTSAAFAESFDEGVLAFVKGDGEKAYRIWKPLADKGDIEAQYHLGYMFQTGTGIRKDNKKALYWYNLAAKNGHGKAYVLVKVIEKEMSQ